MTLTKKQREIVNFISEFRNEHGLSPSYHEIREALDLKAVSTVFNHLRKLMNKGVLSRNAKARSIEFTPEFLAFENGREGNPCVTADQLQKQLEKMQRELTSMRERDREICTGVAHALRQTKSVTRFYGDNVSQAVHDLCRELAGCVGTPGSGAISA